MAGRKKKILFYTITLLTPFLFLGAVELTLRLFQVGDKAPELFITNPTNRNQYIMNPAVAQRYFPEETFATVGAYDPFDKIKQENTIRIFVQGASSSAGFPFRAASFPRLLEQKLQYFYPQYKIEVVNTSLVATNSYTVRDLVPEIIEQQPDYVIIYSGHNEYYGALGVGSSQRLGQYPSVTNLYLRLKNLRLVQVIKKAIKGTVSANEQRKDETLMAKMIKEKQISFGSETEALGVKQYRTNIEHVLDDYEKANVPVLLSTLVSNLKDFPPFASDTEGYNAQETFEKGRYLFEQGDTLQAKNTFEMARNYDLIKFRAPTKIEKIIPELANKYEVELLDMRAAFEMVSPIVGNELIIEHVHANLEGQKLWAETAFETLRELFTQKGIMPEEVEVPFAYAISETDSTYAYQMVEGMMKKWPFVPVDQELEVADNPILNQITRGEISFDQLLLKAYYAQLTANPSKAWQTAHVLWQEYGNTDHLLLEVEALKLIANYERAALLLDRFPEHRKNYRFYEVSLYLALSQNKFQEALSFAQKYLEERYDLHTQKVKESIGFVLNHPELSAMATEVDIRRSANDYVALLEAYAFMKQMQHVEQLKTKLLKYIPDNPELARLKQQGLL